MQGRDPASCDEDASHDARETAGVEHLTPAGTERQFARHHGQQVAVKVGPPVGGVLVAETSVEFDGRAEVDVVDVAECRALPLVDATLPFRRRQPVRSSRPATR